MPKVRLNDKSVRAPAPKTGQIELWDSDLPGFGLRIAAGGARTYFIMRRLNGKLVRRTIGKVPPASLNKDAPLQPGEYWPADARPVARKALEDLARGIDPRVAPKAGEIAPAKTPETFGEVVDGYFADPSKRGGGSLRTKAELERRARVDLADWKERSVSSITRADIEALINRKFDTAPISANRLLALVKRIFRWASRRNLIGANPAVDVDPPGDEVERDRVLSVDELVRIWKAADVLGYPFGPLLKLLILTGQRRSEVAEATWAEIDGDAWKLPDARAKRGKGHLVPLSPLAKTILSEAPRIGDPPTFVFTTGKRRTKTGAEPPPDVAPVSGWSRMKLRLDLLIAKAAAKDEDLEKPAAKHFLEPWTLHDIRRSVATALRDADVVGKARVDRLTVSKILNHTEGGATKIYDRYANDPEKRAALKAWAEVIKRRAGLNVVDLKGKRA